MAAKKQLTLGAVNAPLPVRWINGLARMSKPVSEHLVALKKESLLAAAARRTGLQDWGDPRFEDKLTALVDSVNREGRLTFFGRFTLKQFLIESLSCRLRIVEVLNRFPQIQQQNIQRPIFLTGWYRTGTTHLHNLLASHPAVRAPLFWELRHPCPTLDPRSANPRRQIRKVQLAQRIHRYLAPGFIAIHPLAAEKPEECLHLFDKACAGTTPFFITEAKSFAWWLFDHSIQDGYEFYKRQLQLLNWLRPGRKWVLKWPYHLWHLNTLMQTFPDATIIQLHRDPREAIPSVSSLAAAARAPFCESIEAEALGRFWLDYYEAGLKRSFMARKNASTIQIIDVRYPDLKQNPLKVLNQILKTSKLDDWELWTRSIAPDLKIMEKEMPAGHHYSLPQFGLDANLIRERFSSYIQDYNLTT